MTQGVDAEIPCPVCRSADSSNVSLLPEDYEYQVEIAADFGLRACRYCGSEFVWPRPGLDQLRRMYPDNYYAYDQEMSRFWQALYHRRCRSEAKRLLQLSPRRPLRLFDVGAGDCRLFRAIEAASDFEFSGVEMNERMAGAAREAGYDIVCGTFEEFDPSGREGRVDVLQMNHVIEHVVDLRETLAKVHDILAQDGVFYGRTPKLASLGNRMFGRYWGGYHFPRHLQLFTAESLESCLRGSGFREVEIIEDLNLFPALSLQNFLVGKLRLPLSLQGGHTRIWTLLVALTIPLSFIDYFTRRGDCMIFIARK